MMGSDNYNIVFKNNSGKLLKGQQEWPWWQKESRGQRSRRLRSYTLGDWGVQLVLRAPCLSVVYDILS